MNQVLGEYKENDHTYKVLSQKLKELKSEKTLDKQQLAAKVEEYDLQVDERKHLYDKIKNLESVKTLAEQLELKRKYKKQLKQLDDPELDEKQAKQLLEANLKYEDQYEAWKEYAAAKKKAKEYIEQYNLPATRKELNTLRSKLEGKIARLEMLTVRGEYRKVKSADKLKALSEDLDMQLSTAKASKSSLESRIEELEHFKNHKGNKCPLCSTKLSDSIMDVLKNKAKEYSSKLETEVKNIRRITSEYNQVLADIKQSELNDKIKASDEAKETIVRLEKKYPPDIINKCITLLSRDKQDKPEKPTHSSKELRVIIETHEKRSRLKSLIASIKVEDVSDKGLDKLPALKKRYELLVETLPQIKADIELAKQNRAARKKLKAQMKDLEDANGDREVYELLREAYSTNGLKQLVLKNICVQIEKNLNKFSPFVFRENYRFKVVVSNSKIDVLVNRKYKNKVITSDVKALSGAESRMFSMLNLLAILPLIPKSRRCNTLIVDEPTANLDAPYIKMFTQRILPQLNRIIPHIVVISPLEDHKDVQNCKLFKIVKSGDTSTIVPS